MLFVLPLAAEVKREVKSRLLAESIGESAVLAAQLGLDEASASDNTPVIAIEGLTKVFRGARAIDEVTLSIPRGHIVGLVGPNSAGKSTLLRHIVGIYLPTGGSCRTFGVEARKLSDAELARIGYVHQEGQLLDWLSTDDIIRYTAAHYPRWNRELERMLVEPDLRDRRVIDSAATSSPRARPGREPRVGCTRH